MAGDRPGQPASAKVVARLMSFAQITCYVFEYFQ